MCGFSCLSCNIRPPEGVSEAVDNSIGKRLAEEHEVIGMPARIPKCIAAFLLYLATALFTGGCLTGENGPGESDPIPPDDLSNGPWTVDQEETDPDSTSE